MDLAEPENRREPGYSRTRFQGSDQPGPELIRTLDGHRVIPRTERENVDIDHEFTANEYDCEEEY